jgi:hypothetical protein
MVRMSILYARVQILIGSLVFWTLERKLPIDLYPRTLACVSHHTVYFCRPFLGSELFRQTDRCNSRYSGSYSKSVDLIYRTLLSGVLTTHWTHSSPQNISRATPTASSDQKVSAQFALICSVERGVSKTILSSQGKLNVPNALVHAFTSSGSLNWGYTQGQSIWVRLAEKQGAKK